jgi:hypothetical protein
MEQLLAHVFGDYVLQSDWLALGKRKSFVVALIHALVYGVPFLLLRGSGLAWLVIVVSHAVIDHTGLARYVCFAKNFLAPPSEWPRWKDTNATGYDKSKPVWMSTWLFIIADNALHLAINYAALRWL